MMEALLEPQAQIINLESLKARFLGNAELLERVLATFARTLDADIGALEQAILTRNAESAAFLAHRIKGMAASVEARVLWKNASQAEECAKSNALDQLAKSLSRLHADRADLAEVLRLESCPTS